MKPYVHRHLRLPPLITLLVLPIFAVVSYLMGNQWFLIPLLTIVVINVWTASQLVRVDQQGMKVRGRRGATRVPWLSIDTVSLSTTDPPELRIGLKQGAPLPEGAGGAIHDPRTQTVTVGDLQGSMPGIDPLALEGALERFGRRRLMRH